MATITIEDVPEQVVAQYGTRIKFSNELSFEQETPLDFRPLEAHEVTPEMIKNMNETMNTPRSEFSNI